jgi:hypothetical protein
LKRLRSTALTAKESAAGVVKPYLRREPVPQIVSGSNQPVVKSLAGSPPALMADRQYLNQPKVAASSDAAIAPSMPINSGSLGHDSKSDIKWSERMLRYDGLYITKLPVDYGITAHSYLRFYDDGTVIESSIQGDRSAEAIRWFDKGDGSISNGSYSTDGDEIQFSVRSASGTVDYSGRIVGGELHLHSHSHINGFETDDEWAFVAAS